MALAETIEAASKGFEGVLGVAVKHLGTGECASLNGDEVFLSASVRKIAVVAEIYRQVEEGGFRLEDTMVLRHLDKVPGTGILRELTPGLEVTYKDLITLMMILSDNSATDYLVGKIGEENVNRNLRRLGLEKTRMVYNSREVLFELIGLGDLPETEKTIDRFRREVRLSGFKSPPSIEGRPDNVTTPREMLRLIEAIVDCVAVSKKSSEAILKTMARCQTGTSRIPKYLPQDMVEVAHKTGSLPGVRNDAGVVTPLNTGERYILSCFTKDAVDGYAAEEVVARVSKAIYDYFQRRS
jgi:beta-lactamase class A